MRGSLSSVIHASLALLLLSISGSALWADESDALKKLGQRLSDSALLEGGTRQTAPPKSIYATSGAAPVADGLGFASSGDVRERNQATLARIRDQQARLADQKRALADRSSTLDEIRARLSEQKWKLTDMRSRMSDQQWKLADMRSRMSDQQWKLADMRSRMSDQQWKLADMRSRMSDQQWKLADMRSRMMDQQVKLVDLKSRVLEQQEHLQLQNIRMRAISSSKENLLVIAKTDLHRDLLFNNPRDYMVERFGIGANKQLDILNRSQVKYNVPEGTGRGTISIQHYPQRQWLWNTEAAQEVRTKLGANIALGRQSLETLNRTRLYVGGGVLLGAAGNALAARDVAANYRNTVVHEWNRSSPSFPSGNYKYTVINGQIRNLQYTPRHQ